MNNKISILFLFLSLAIGCKEDTSLVFVSESLTDADVEICKTTSCPDVTVAYVRALGDEVVSEKINSKIKGFIIESLYMGDEEKAPTAPTISEAISGFIKMYRTHSAEFPDMSAEYFAEISVSETYISEDLIGLELRNYLYTGGAHGYGSVTFLNLDSSSGKEIASEQLFKDFPAFTKIAEEKFREAHEIPNGDAINSTGFWFENDIFSLPESIGVTKESIILRYNPYDIASYAAGPIELEIPKGEVKPFLNFN